MKMPGIYKIQSICRPERIYIGSAVNLIKRKNQHFQELKRQCHSNCKIQRHYNKYGKDDLIFIIIEPCLPEFLIIREQFYIDTINPWFNICKKAGSPGSRPSKPLSNETKLKISIALKGKPCPWNKGLIRSEEVKEKIRQAHIGKKMTVEARIKMSISAKGRKRSDETKKRMSLAQKGNKKAQGFKHTIETRKKQSEGIKRYYANKKLLQLNMN